MPDLALAVLAVSASIAVIASAFTGIGLAVRRSFGLRDVRLDDCLIAFWTGYGITTVFLIAWNFVFPIGPQVLPIILGAGASGLVLSRGDLAAFIRKAPGRTSLLELFLLALGLAWVVLQCLGDFQSWDGGLYHVPSVNWAKHFAVVPGIANLHGPLGFNQSSFLYDAMVDTGMWQARGFHLANGVLAAVGIALAITHGVRWFQAREPVNNHLFGFVTLAVVLHFSDHIANYSTDLPVALLLMVAATGAYGLLDESAANRSPAERAYSFFAVGLMLVTAVSVKLTAATFAALTIGVLAGVSSRRQLISRRTMALIIATVGVIAALWIARGIVMSGYPLFPVSAAGMPVDWRVPSEHAEAEVAYAVHTERAFTWRFIGGNWVRLMLLRDIYAAAVPSLIVVGAVLFAWRSWRRASRSLVSASPAWWLLLPILASIGVWFVSAPSHRYSPALFWSLAALCLAECQRIRNPGRLPMSSAALLTLVLVSPVIVQPAISAMWQRKSILGAIASHNWFTHSSAALPVMNGSVTVKTFTTDSGLELNVPVRNTAAPGSPNACWDAPLPCTPNPAPNLRLRVPGALSAGFRVDGDWKMLDWPYYWHAYFLPEWQRRR